MAVQFRNGNKKRVNFDGNKKRKRDNFKRKSKKFASNSRNEQGKTLTDVEYNYYKNIFGLLNRLAGEERELMVHNFLKGLLEEADVKKLVSHQIISRLLDSALLYAKAAQVLSLTEILSKDIGALCIDPYASHVLQTLMSLSLKYSQDIAMESNKEGDDDDEKASSAVTEEQREEFISFLEKVGRIVYNNLDEFIRNPYGSHIVRSVLETCSGVTIEKTIKASNKAQLSHSLCHDAGQILKIPPVLQDLLSDMADRMMMLPDLPGIVTTSCSSAALQSALIVLKGVESKKCSSLVDHILINGFPPIKPEQCDKHEYYMKCPLLFQSNASSRLLEALMSCATADQQSKIFSDYFKDHMSDLVQHRVCNFAVQKLLSSWKEKETFIEVFDAVQEVLPKALKAQNNGVLVSLCQACKNLNKNQGQFWKTIAELFHFYEPQERQETAAQCLLFFLNYDDYLKNKAIGNLPQVSYHGSLILQDLLHYTRTLKIVTSILAMNLADLQLLTCDERGSHIITAFTSSKFVKGENKARLIQSFKGSYTSLACSKLGSRSLESMWAVASMKQKTAICEELASEELKLKNNRFGAIIYSKFNVRLFKMKDKQNWEEVVNTAAKKEKLLTGLLSDLATEEPKKKNIKKKHNDKNAEPENKKLNAGSTEEPKKKKKKLDVNNAEESKKKKIKKELDTDNAEGLKKKKKKLDVKNADGAKKKKNLKKEL